MDNIRYSFLMIGQSNMAGRGDISQVEPIHNPSCQVMRNGLWQTMYAPVNPDRAFSGISLAESFADEFQKSTGRLTGLIPCADGGTMLSQWMPGEILFDHAVFMTNLARRTSKISGILWHQGESDVHSSELIASYPERFIKMISGLRNQTDTGNVPLILGEISSKLTLAPEENIALFNKNLKIIASELPLCAVASEEGLSLKSDNLHFTASSAREFGKRYYECYKKLANI